MNWQRDRKFVVYSVRARDVGMEWADSRDRGEPSSDELGDNGAVIRSRYASALKRSIDRVGITQTSRTCLTVGSIVNLQRSRTFDIVGASTWTACQWQRLVRDDLSRQSIDFARHQGGADVVPGRGRR